MESGCLDTKPWGDIVDKCFEDVVKVFMFCVDIRMVWVVLPVVNGSWLGDGGIKSMLYCYRLHRYILCFIYKYIPSF